VARGRIGSAQRTRAILARVAKVLERRGKLDRRPGCGLRCGAEEWTQGAEARPAEKETEEEGSGVGRKEKGEAPTGGVGRPVGEKRGRGRRGNWAGARPTREKEGKGARGGESSGWAAEEKERGEEARGRRESGLAWPMREEGGEKESWAG
jgi:hypothetical protein